MAKSYVGSCTRLMTGGDFHVERSHAAEMSSVLKAYLENEWIAKGLWDNEQVSLGYLIFEKAISAKIVDTSFGYANLVRQVFGLPLAKAPPRRPSLLTRALIAFGR